VIEIRLDFDTRLEIPEEVWARGVWVDVTTHNDPLDCSVWLRVRDLPRQPVEDREFKDDDDRRPDERLPE
jgi:hypothetical protein